MPLIIHGSPVALGLSDTSDALQQYNDQQEELRRNRFREGLQTAQLGMEQRRQAALEREQEQRSEFLKQQAARLSEEQAARQQAADAESFGFQQQYQAPVAGGGEGPAALSLPPELWGDYHATTAALAKTTDPRARAQIADDARARWTTYTLQKKSKEVAGRVDDMLSSLEAEQNPDQQGPKDQQAAPEAQGMRQQLEQVRDLVSSGKMDPVQAESALIQLQGAAAEKLSFARSKAFTLDFINKQVPTVTSQKDRRELDQIASALAVGMLKPEQAYQDAVKAIHGFSDVDMMQGSGRPYSEAPPVTRARITQQARQNALAYLKADPAFQKDAGGTSDQFRSRYQELVLEETQNLARANGWSEDLPTPWGMTPGTAGPAIDLSAMTPNGPDQPARPVDMSVLDGVPADVQEAAREAYRRGDSAAARKILETKKVPEPTVNEGIKKREPWYMRTRD